MPEDEKPKPENQEQEPPLKKLPRRPPREQPPPPQGHPHPFGPPPPHLLGRPPMPPERPERPPLGQRTRKLIGQREPAEIKPKVERPETEGNDAPRPAPETAKSNSADEALASTEATETSLPERFSFFGTLPWFKITLLFVFFVVIAGSAGGVIYYWFLRQTTDSLEQAVIVDFNDPDSLLEQFALENGGREHLQWVRSMRIKGEVSEGGASLSFINIKSIGGDFWLKIIDPRGELVTAFEAGGEIWRSLQVPSGKVHYLPVEAAEQKYLRQSFVFFDPLVDYLLAERSDAEFLGEVELPGIEGKLSQIRLPARDGTHESISYLEHEHFQVVMREDYYVAGEAPTKTWMENYHQYQGTWIPEKLTIQQKEKPEQTIIIREIKLNPGVLKVFFQPPENYSSAFVGPDPLLVR